MHLRRTALALIVLAVATTAAAAGVLRAVVQFDSPQLASDAPDRLPRTIWRSGTNLARIEGMVSVETGHRMLLVADSPHLWLADLDTATGQHSVDPGPKLGAHLPLFPVQLAQLEELEFGNEAEFFRRGKARPMGRTTMNGRTCDRQDIETAEYLLIGCFEPFTARPVAIGLRLGEQVMGMNYLEYDRNATPPEDAFAQPARIRFTDRPHEDTTHAAH